MTAERRTETTVPANDRPRSRVTGRRAWFARAVLLVFGLGSGLVAAECLLRVMQVAPPSRYCPDPICGSRLQPNYAGWQTAEGRVLLRTNAAGFRDRPHTLDKPSETIRILILGDSYCEAAQVELEETFWSQVETRLNRAASGSELRFEVINTGVSGYGTAQQLLMLRHYAKEYQPDIVALCFFSGNDIRNNSQELEPDQLKPFFHLEDGQLALDNSFLDEPFFTSRWIRCKDRAIRSSRLLTLLYRFKHQSDTSPLRSDAISEPGLDDFIYLSPETAAQQTAWRLTERLIEEIQRESKQINAQFLVVTITTSIQVHPDASVREAFCQRLGVEDLSYPDQRIKRLGEQLGFSTIVLAPRMREYAESTNKYLHGFANTVPGQGHWNPTGHRVAAEIIATELLQGPQLSLLPDALP